MGLLNRLFETTESLVEEIVADDASLLKQWNDYLGSVDKKSIDDIREMKKLLRNELSDIGGEKKEEHELLADLESLGHAKKMKRVHRIEECLGYIETKHEYVYELLRELHETLKKQMYLVDKLLGDPKNHEKLRHHLREEIEVEKNIIGKLGKMETFHESFLVLLKGEHVIRKMDENEKKLLAKMQKGVNKIFSGELTRGIVYEWAMAVFDSIEDKVHEGVANHMFAGYHPDIDLEFVNRPEFVDLVKESIRAIRKKEVSDDLINVFVHLFREWFNERN